MKTISLILFFNFLILFSSCNPQTKPIEKIQPKIDFIITNDYMSERNLSFMGGPVPANYKKGLIDTLENSFVEVYDDNKNIVQEKYYNRIGALYSTTLNFYDIKNRIEKTLKIDEFKNDTCTIRYKYTDSLNLVIHKRLNSSCDSNFLDFYFKYDEKGKKTEDVLNLNNKLFSKDFIQDISKNERRIKSYDEGNRLSTYLFKYNDKDLLIYETVKEKLYNIEIMSEYEYLYKYDKNGNWIERIMQRYSPPKKKVATKPKLTNKKKTNKKKSISIDEIILIPVIRNEIKEKLVRKIYYKP